MNPPKINQLSQTGGHRKYNLQNWRGNGNTLNGISNMSTYVSVSIREKDGTSRIVVEKIGVSTLTAASAWAADNLAGTGTSPETLLLPESIPAHATKRIFEWLCSFNLPFSKNYKGHPQIPIHDEDDFQDLVELYYASKLLRLYRHFSNQSFLRHKILGYISHEALTREGVVEIWRRFHGYDKGLVRITLRQTVDYINEHDSIYKGLFEIHVDHFAEWPELLQAFMKIYNAKHIFERC